MRDGVVQHQHSSACRILCTCASARVFGIHAKSTYTLRACKRECVNVSACMPQPLGRTNQAHVDPSHRSTRASTVARVCVCVIEETSHSLGDLFLELIVAGLFQFCFFGRKSITFFLQLQLHPLVVGFQVPMAAEQVFYTWQRGRARNPPRSLRQL